jgi:hypothetical protein
MTTHIDRCSIAFNRENCCTAVKPSRRRPIIAVMEFTHACSFCGWSRLSTTPVMLEPSCSRCGCALDARVVAPTTGAAAALALPALWTRAGRAFGVLIAVLALYTATKAGYDLAGGAGALIAFGMGGFLLVPFVPQRLR